MIAHDLDSIADTLAVWADENFVPGPRELATLAFTIRATAVCVERLEALEVAQVTIDRVAAIMAEMEEGGSRLDCDVRRLSWSDAGMTDYPAPDDRWPAPLATLFIVGSSLALWGGIYLAARAIFG